MIIVMMMMMMVVYLKILEIYNVLKLKLQKFHIKHASPPHSLSLLFLSMNHQVVKVELEIISKKMI